MPLTDTAIRQSKPADKPYKLTDGGGMHLLVKSAGRYWRLDYRFDGKRKTLALGVYPDVTLKQAREKREEAKRLLAEGVDPGEFKKVAGVKSTVSDATVLFENVAREWFMKHAPSWAKGHSDKIIQRLERDVFPWLGDRPVHTITAQELLACIRRIEARGTIDTAHRALQNAGQIFRYAIATGRAERNPATDLRGALPPAKEGHFAAITDPVGFGQLLRAIETYQGFLPVRCALRVLPMVFVRPGELRMAEWTEFNLDAAEWSIPAARMKSGLPHIVPLSTQAVSIFRDLQPFSGHGQFVFPTPRNKNAPVSNMAFNAALKAIGYSGKEMTAHGFRATARTLLDEVLGFKIELIEHQLAHAVRDPLGRAYNRTTHLPERRKMMQSWANYLDDLRHGSC
ncbi:MAG: integrase arm-type DNA-binding domain-containing protein [Magnetococcales bacterium]|nr:integrase arm-type DNA-binding domain-containing protein [Magnetococcales bacterium]